MDIMFILIILFAISLSQAQKCRTVSLEAGGSHGAYEAGVVWALANLTSPGGIAWDVASGVSAGSINVGGIVQYPLGQEIAMGNFLLDTVHSINGTSDIFVEWEGGLIDGLLFHSGLYDNSPL